MIASMHMADVGPAKAAAALGRTPPPDAAGGLVYADVLTATRLSPAFMPRVQAGRVALFAVWRDDAALDGFLAGHPLAATFSGRHGRSMRLEPLRTSGRWTGLPELVDADRAPAGMRPAAADAHDDDDDKDDEPVAVLTYGRLKLNRARAFLKTSARAEGEAVSHPGLVTASGLARPPRLVSTFSVWSSAAAMSDYARRGAGHTAALRATAERDFHHESIFIRFRPYAAEGDWDRT